LHHLSVDVDRFILDLFALAKGFARDFASLELFFELVLGFAALCGTLELSKVPSVNSYLSPIATNRDGAFHRIKTL
jgi:hypothetical protein